MEEAEYEFPWLPACEVVEALRNVQRRPFPVLYYRSSRLWKCCQSQVSRIGSYEDLHPKLVTLLGLPRAADGVSAPPTFAYRSARARRIEDHLFGPMLRQETTSRPPLQPEEGALMIAALMEDMELTLSGWRTVIPED